jgi:hypothetical protein
MTGAGGGVSDMSKSYVGADEQALGVAGNVAGAGQG